MDGQRETRPCRKRYGPGNGPVYYQRQRKVEASCKILIVGERLTEEKRRRRTCTCIRGRYKYDNFWPLQFLNSIVKM